MIRYENAVLASWIGQFKRKVTAQQLCGWEPGMKPRKFTREKALELEKRVNAEMGEKPSKAIEAYVRKQQKIFKQKAKDKRLWQSQ